MDLLLRCEITGSICGTDTTVEGCPCLCDTCVQALRENQQETPERFRNAIAENFWELS